MKKITQTIALDNVQWVTYVLSLPWSDVEPFDAALARFFFFFSSNHGKRKEGGTPSNLCAPDVVTTILRLWFDLRHTGNTYFI